MPRFLVVKRGCLSCEVPNSTPSKAAKAAKAQAEEAPGWVESCRCVYLWKYIVFFVQSKQHGLICLHSFCVQMCKAKPSSTSTIFYS